MLNLSAKIRNPEKDPSEVKEEGKIPGILYGPKIENKIIEFDYKEFEKTHKQSGLSSLINLKIDKEDFPVLIHDFQRDPLTNNFTHVDFYQPNLEEKIEAKVPLIFEGQSKAVKDLEGTLIKHIQELEVKAVPQKLPREIKVDIGGMDNFEDTIEVKDLNIPEDVEVLRESDEIIVSVSAPENVEEELSKPVEEFVPESEESAEGEGEEKETEKEEKEEKEEKSEEGDKKEEK